MSNTQIAISKTGIFIVGAIIVILIGLLFVNAGAKETYHNCTQAKAAGKGNIKQDDPNYNVSLDRDHDGIACEL